MTARPWAARPAHLPAQHAGLADRLIKITPESAWTQVAAVPLRFRTFHPQGLVKIGSDFHLSSVEVRRRPRPAEPREGIDGDAGEGVGQLFKFDGDGALRADLQIGEGDAYHPCG